MNADGPCSIAIAREASIWPESAVAPIEQAARTARDAEPWAPAFRLDFADLDPRRLEIGVSLIDDAAMRALNRDHRGKDRPTNVLAFPLLEPGAPLPPEGPLPIGDVAIAYQTTRAEAEAAGFAFERHAVHLVTHGVLHLFGHDHETDDEAALMEQTESALMTSQGWPDPWAPSAVRA